MKRSLKAAIVLFLFFIFPFTLNSCERKMDDLIKVVLDKNKTVFLSVKQKMNVELRSNPTTGYHWEIINRDTRIVNKIASRKYIPDQYLENRVGSGGVEHFLFKAFKPGEGKILFVYKKPWEKLSDSGKEYELTVKVR